MSRQGDDSYWADSANWPDWGEGEWDFLPPPPEVQQMPDVAHTAMCAGCRHELALHSLEGTDFVDHPLDGRMMLRERWTCSQRIVAGTAQYAKTMTCPCSVFKADPKFVKGMVEEPPL